MSLLRFLADSYEQSQQLRIEAGERIRAVLQDRDQSMRAVDGYVHKHPKPKKGDKPVKCAHCVSILSKITSGEVEGPVPILGHTYRRHFAGEREAHAAMRDELDNHPAWPWLKHVPGVAEKLACKLLARLDIRKADTPSAFWAYCGLATVPAVLYRCKTCRLEKSWPPDFNVSGRHKTLNSKRKCKGSLVKAGEGRCAQPKPRSGEKASYDQYAKKVCYLIGMQFLKAVGSPFDNFYWRMRSRLERERPGWDTGRIHYATLRNTEKLFLSLLWLVWREAEGLPVTQPWAQAKGGHDGYIDPWEMIGKSRDTRKTPKSRASRLKKVTHRN